MNTLITHDIKVSVKADFEPDHSDIHQGKFLYSYHITIENLSKDPVQLLDRKWYIYDSIPRKESVYGEGVIGQQPVILPGGQHEYQSWCPLRTTIGYMCGNYTMINLNTNQKFKVEIPQFELIPNYRLN